VTELLLRGQIASLYCVKIANFSMHHGTNQIFAELCPLRLLHGAKINDLG